jgi:hypothetical protein
MSSKFSGGNFPKSYLDSRDDLGYGRANPKYHLKKALGGSTFPYWDESEGMDVDDVEVEDELIDDVRAKSTGPQGQDPLAKRGTNPFYYVAGNTKLGEAMVSNSISPVPGMYKNTRRTASGGKLVGRTARADASTMAPTMDSGEHEGWAYLYEPYNSDKSEEPIEDLESLAIKQVRECVRLILLGFGE